MYLSSWYKGITGGGRLPNLPVDWVVRIDYCLLDCEYLAASGDKLAWLIYSLLDLHGSKPGIKNCFW